ncbi:MAG: M20/M25/M40 family metallo-hydrolase [Planctomycetales bacterium]|nr:M20/M25/M40 family metallo-hydrolase [Planctomycetales bacterium]
MTRIAVAVALVAANVHSADPHAVVTDDITDTDPKAAAALEAELITQARQLTFDGRRAGEGYFSADGERMVFQSERSNDNPFFQIYLMDFETGDIERVSPGHGKTTCAWIHPSGDRVLFASTQNDPKAKEKQQKELELRAAGNERRYSWDYDSNFEIFEYDVESKSYKNLTSAVGYDAEGSYSPDGKLIAFASNRHAYSSGLSKEQRERFELDPANMMDLYIMNSDGSNVRRLTDVPGYDGGPFFSPDGKRICWRRFSEDGATAEIMMMNVDGSGVRQLTEIGAMSWAPFFHPSGEYLIFTTNKHGFANFELYLIDAAAESEPVRVTYTKGFDGLPVFTPDGKQISWTSNRTSTKQSQIFIGNWHHEAALAKLAETKRDRITKDTEEVNSAVAAANESELDESFSAQDVLRHVDYLCRPELKGRRTGTLGEKLATAYVAACFDKFGLEPAGDNGSWYQEFDFTSGVALGETNELTMGDTALKIGEDWLPLSFSKTGKVEPAPIVFAGYGIAAPKDDDNEEYDSFVHLDVKDKWVLALRFMPEGISAEQRQHLGRHSSLRFKAMLARDKGARGLILVSGPSSNVKNQLVKLQFDGSMSGSSVPVISVTDKVAEEWLLVAGKDLQTIQQKLDTGELAMGFEIPHSLLSASIDIKKIRQSGRNVLGRLPAVTDAEQSIVVGAHIDHLGEGSSSSSLAKEDEKELIHFGADDNASGVAATLEIAQYLAARKANGKFKPKRDIIFAGWSGEEIGLIGSSHFVNSLGENPYPGISSCINMDMVGRMDKKLVLQGVGSSSIWPSEIERRNIRLGIPISVQNDSYIPTDASVFFMHGIPILSAFTGSHSEYHTPRDTPDRLNYEGAAEIANFMGLVTRSLALRDNAPDYIEQARPNEGQQRARLRAYLGSIPDYAEGEVKGVALSGVAKGGPCDKAGLMAGDVIVELAGKKIENIYDYTYAIEALKIGQPTQVAVTRKGKRMEFEVVPGSRE